MEPTSFLNEVVTVATATGAMTVAAPTVVNVLKRLGVVEDGTADQLHRGLQLIVFFLIGTTQLFDIDYGPTDALITQLAEVLQSLLQIGTVFVVGPIVNTKVLRGASVIGESFSLNTELLD